MLSDSPPSDIGAARRLVRRVDAFFRPYVASEPVAARFRARQLQAVLRLTPLTLLANGVNVLLVGLTFWPQGHALFLLVWGTVVLTTVHRGLRAWLHWRRSHGSWRTASPRAMQRAVWNASALAALWGVMPVVLFTDADGPGRLLLAVITTGMICAGGFALATVPVAGTAYVLLLGAGFATMLWFSDFPLAAEVGLLLAVYMAIVIASVWLTARLFGARLMAEAVAERQSEVVGLLLRDFEENASDVLWEIDTDGRLCHVSPRLAAMLGLPEQRLAELTVSQLARQLLAGDDGALAQWAELRRRAALGQPFRDLPLAIRSGGETRCWSVSARPLQDPDGRCTGWRGVAADVTEAQRAKLQLSWMAHHDALTGLANRHQFRAALAALLAPHDDPPRASAPFALMCLDLDHFKTINDTLGHAVGDGLLQEVARRLGASSRRGDTVARLGGDEFAVILPGVATTDEAERLARRLLDGLQAPCDVQGSRIAVRTSVGVAMAPRDGAEIDALLNNADMALYAAKSSGRGVVRLFSSDMAALTRRRLVVEQELRQALARGELTLAFQAQVSVSDWRVTGFEALLRWRHPQLGDVSPVEFMPVAEESGLVVEIGAWVMAEACRQAAGWPGEPIVSVNVSPVQALSADLCRTALASAASARLPPSRLELELTESIFLHEKGGAVQSLHALREAGLRIALDDFGTGYSSLAYLRRFPFDTLKIDRSFIREVLTQPDARAIVKMIVGLARTLAMKVVAEGVEEPSQVGVLSHYGCDTMQGFLFARPIPGDQVPAFLAAWTAQPPMPVPAATPTAPMPLRRRLAVEL